ncbi:hypothetical protein AJ87_35900 [Rhizobium yanglingense]|nr:hypothetical protein AJ87_35900 [Rhizobium yanglingense]
MELQGLVAAHMQNRRRPTPMDPSAEDRYYSDHITPLRPRLRLLGLTATTAGAILLLVGIAQA